MTPGPAFGFNQRPYIYYNGEWHQCPCTISNIPAGTPLKAGAWVREKNNEAGRGWFGPNIGSSTLCWMSESFSGGDTKWIECNFEMPSSTSSVEFKCGSLESSIRYIHDTDCCITLELGIDYCSQNVRVVTSDGASVYAHVVWGDGADEYGTTPNVFTHRYEKGKTRTITASAYGYDSDSETFTTCKSQFTLTLQKKIDYCTQEFLVKHPDGAIAPDAYVHDDLGNYCKTLSSGKCSMDYGIGEVHTAHAHKDGYSDSDEKSFTTCEGTITLTLKEIGEEAWKTVGTPYWDADVVKIDCVAQNLSVIYGYFAIAYCAGTSVSTYQKLKPDGASERSVVLNIPKEKIDKSCSPLPFNVEIVLIREWTEIDRVTKIIPQKEEITCEEPTPHFASGCKLLLEYDFRKDGKIDAGEIVKARNDLSAGIITQGEYDFVNKVSVLDSINALCPNCYAPLKMDTTICNFDVLDAEGKKVTDLVAGVRYTVRAWLCEKHVKSCAVFPLEGCFLDSYNVKIENLKLVLFGAMPPVVAEGTTDADGYASMFWTPSADIAGDNSIRMEFKGSTNYNACESDWKTVTVGGLRIKCDCTNIDVGDYVFLQEVKKVGGKWVWYALGGGESKKVTADKVVYFTEHDPILGFEVGKHYAIVAWKWWEWYTVFKPLLNFIVPDFAVIELKEGLNEVTVRYQVSIVGTTMCGFFGIDPESTECGLFLAEFLDPVFVANTLSVIINHEDLEGNPREPETLDYVMLPIVMVGSLLPMVPVGKIGQWVGRGLKLGKRPDDMGRASRLFLIKYQDKIHHLTAVGDETRILRFKTFFDADNLDEALKVLREGVTSSEATEALKSTKRLNLGKWIRGLRAKWKVDKPKTTIEKLMDDAAEHGGNVFKTQADVVVKHVDDAKGDWTKIRKIWDDTVKTADDVVYVDLHLAGKSDEVQVIHNMMRYTKDDFVKALKAEDAINPKFANRFDEGVDFMLKHIGDETGMEVAKYRKAIKGLSDADINNIVKNLDAVGQPNLARIIKTCKVAPERGMKYFDDAADTLKGAKKFSATERKALGGVLDTGFDDAAKHLDEKWKGVFSKIFDTEDSVKNPHFKRFWGHVRGHDKTKDMMARYGVSRFRDLPFFAKVATFTGIFFIFYGSFKIMMDMCMALFMGEETIQWGGFGGIVLNNMLRDFKKKPLTEKKEIIKVFEDFSAKRHAIHDGVVKGSPLFEKLCLIFGDVYRRFWEADAVNLWALDTTIEYLRKDINPFTGIGECTVRARANKDGVDFWYQGSPTKWHGGRAFSWTEIKLVPVRATPEEVTICAWKAGYLMDTHIIKIFPEDVGATKEMALFELIPESTVSETPNPFPYPTPPDTSNLPPPYGDADPREYIGEELYGSIRCESIPTGAGVYLDVKDSAHYKGKTDITLSYIPIGSHRIIQTFPNFGDCVVDVNVVVEPIQYARCRFPTPTCSFTPSTTKPKIGETVTFDASASTPGTGATSLTYDWDWGDAKTHGTKKIDTHAYGTKGVYTVKLTVTNEMGGSKVCTTNITVEVPTGWIECYCTCSANAKPSYCASERGTKILVDGKEVGTTRESGYTKITLTTGKHIVKYNLLNVMESTPAEITVVEGAGVAYHGELKSILPTSQPARITEIIDGDSIKVDVVDREIRLIGIDAYESGTAFGVYGKDKLTELIPGGSVITLKVDQYLPLDGYNRVIAGAFKGGIDIVVEMLKSCLVNITVSKYRYKYFWIDWDDYALLWKDPLGTGCLLHPSYKPLISDIDTTTKTFKIDNRWKTLFFKAEFYDKANAKLGETSVMQIDGGKLSETISYFAGTYLIKLFACIEKCDREENWIQTDYKFVEVVTKTVTILCDVDASIYVNGVKVPGSVAYLERLSKTLRKYRT